MQATSALLSRAASSPAAALSRVMASGQAAAASQRQRVSARPSTCAANQAPAMKLASAPASAMKVMTAAALAMGVISPVYVGPQLGRIGLGIVGGKLGRL